MTDKNCVNYLCSISRKPWILLMRKEFKCWRYKLEFGLTSSVAFVIASFSCSSLGHRWLLFFTCTPLWASFPRVRRCALDWLASCESCKQSLSIAGDGLFSVSQPWLGVFRSRIFFLRTMVFCSWRGCLHARHALVLWCNWRQARWLQWFYLRSTGMLSLGKMCSAPLCTYADVVSFWVVVVFVFVLRL